MARGSPGRRPAEPRLALVDQGPHRFAVIVGLRAGDHTNGFGSDRVGEGQVGGVADVLLHVADGRFRSRRELGRPGGKRRENALRRNAYLQAVHETGARLTHDVKNLLQSLYALTSIAPRGEAGGYDALLQRQLPQLTKRLHATLEKLRAPEIATRELSVTSRAW